MFFGGLAAGATWLAGRWSWRRADQVAAADASGLEPAEDLTHLPPALQQTALWCLADGGFERRVVRGQLPRADGGVAVTAFDLETLRERRGEWAYLPVEPPFRIAGVVSVAACELDRELPHVLLKRAGRGDLCADDSPAARATHVAKAARVALGVARAYPAELPPALPAEPCALALPDGWRAYTRAPELLAALLAGGLHAALAAADRRDLVVELVGALAVVYPAAHDVQGPDALADLATTAAGIGAAITGVTALAPRGIERRI